MKKAATKTKSTKRKSDDVNVMAFDIVSELTAERPAVEPTEEKPEKDSAAVELGRRGGLKGGKARAAKLSPRKRKAIAKKAVIARWTKYYEEKAKEESSDD